MYVLKVILKRKTCRTGVVVQLRWMCDVVSDRHDFSTTTTSRVIKNAWTKAAWRSTVSTPRTCSHSGLGTSWQAGVLASVVQPPNPEQQMALCWCRISICLPASTKPCDIRMHGHSATRPKNQARRTWCMWRQRALFSNRWLPFWMPQLCVFLPCN